MIGQFADHLGRKAVIDYQPFQGADMLDTAADVSKAAKLLGWSPTVSPPDGFRLTAGWHKEEALWLESVTL